MEGERARYKQREAQEKRVYKEDSAASKLVKPAASSPYLAVAEEINIPLAFDLASLSPKFGTPILALGSPTTECVSV